MFYENIDSYDRLQSRNKFLFKTIFPIIILTLFITFYTFSTEVILAITLQSSTTSVDDTEPISLGNFPLDSPPSEEKFLTYLPHSGFHNQHGALMNAIMMSFITNRTLIVPPVLIYCTVPYNPFHLLYDSLNRTISIKKFRKEHCTTDVDGDVTKSPHLCSPGFSNYDRFTMTNWEEILDFTEIKKHIRVVHRKYEFTLKGLQKEFLIPNNETFLLVDEEKYEYRFFDEEDSKEGLERFRKKYLLKELLKVKEKLLHFPSLFSHYRIVLERTENLRFHHLIHKALMVKNPKVLEVSDRITRSLGGKGSFFGLHVRVGDASFKSQRQENLITIYNELKTFINNDTIPYLDKSYLNDEREYDLHECLNRNFPVIYIATDSEDPKQELSMVYDTFPCVYTLSYFTKYLEDFGTIQSDFDPEIDLLEFYVPLIDLLVVAYGGVFIGTENSTFSRMAYELHDLYQGGKIQQHFRL